MPNVTHVVEYYAVLSTVKSNPQESLDMFTTPNFLVGVLPYYWFARFVVGMESYTKFLVGAHDAEEARHPTGRIFHRIQEGSDRKSTFGKSIPKSESWVAQYYVNGQRFRKSTAHPSRPRPKQAARVDGRESERGEKAKPQTQGLTYEDSAPTCLQHYAEKQHKSLDTKRTARLIFSP